MAKTSVADWDTTAANNLDLNNISLAENVMRPPAVNNAFREMMAQIKAGVPYLSGTSYQIALGQLSFPATQNPSSDANTLDDYEEGTWTPTVQFGGGASGMTYATRVGSYVKIGNLVVVSCAITLSAKGSSTGVFGMTGLPYAGNSQGFTAMVDAGASSLSGLTAGLLLIGAAGVTTIYGRSPSSAGTTGSTVITDSTFTNSSSLRFSAAYII